MAARPSRKSASAVRPDRRERADKSELTPFSYAVLALVGPQGAGPHDLVKDAREGRMYWNAAPSQWYAEPKRLAALGYLAARKQPGQTSTRTHYALTRAGRRALARWMATPTELPRMQLEPIVRVLAGEVVGDAALMKSLEGLRDEIRDQRERIAVGEGIARALPHREKYMLLNYKLVRAIVDAHEQWLDEAAAHLAGGEDRPA